MSCEEEKGHGRGGYVFSFLFRFAFYNFNIMIEITNRSKIYKLNLEFSNITNRPQNEIDIFKALGVTPTVL